LLHCRPVSNAVKAETTAVSADNRHRQERGQLVRHLPRRSVLAFPAFPARLPVCIHNAFQEIEGDNLFPLFKCIHRFSHLALERFDFFAFRE
jgi:hypothetical protein